MDGIHINENLMRRIVRSIDKAIADDIPQYLREHYKETNNAIIQLRGDYINENLRNLVVGGDIEFVPFKRYVWQGRIIVDRAEKITYTITTQKTLRAVPRKQRDKPHFLQTLLYIENGGYEAPVKQMTLMDLFPFEAEALENDYNSIVEGLIDPAEGYRHYVIAYDAEGSELRDVQLEFLDKDFNIIETASLNEYIKPDFARLTDVEPVDEDFNDETDGEAKGLVTIKSGLRPKLRDVQKQA
ncbi:MAG: hypothetical protein A2Y23_08720 [Clostridiales bacterium GWB2_37_7]|nr:MAG: hypothetical protein A2Y23_08720 [Clostridiales bacterium GWB2_37_7]